MSFTVFRYLADGTKEETEHKALFDERDALRAEVERLRADLDQQEARWMEEHNIADIAEATVVRLDRRIAELEGALAETMRRLEQWEPEAVVLIEGRAAQGES